MVLSPEHAIHVIDSTRSGILHGQSTGRTARPAKTTTTTVGLRPLWQHQMAIVEWSRAGFEALSQRIRLLIAYPKIGTGALFDGADFSTLSRGTHVSGPIYCFGLAQFLVP